MDTEIIHVTHISNDGSIWAHPIACCDASGRCFAGRADRYYHQVDGKTVIVGHLYEINAGGVIAEIVEE